MSRISLAILGRGEADGAARQLLQGQTGPVRFADPAAWTVAMAVQKALADSGLPLDAGTEDIGLITVSSDGPREVLRHVGRAASAGSMSPLKFPAANPGTLAGLACIVCRLQGPSLNVTMPPSQGIPVALAQLQHWLRDTRIRAGVVAACAYGSETPYARAMVLGSSQHGPGQGRERATAEDWLKGTLKGPEPPDAM